LSGWSCGSAILSARRAMIGTLGGRAGLPLDYRGHVMVWTVRSLLFMVVKVSSIW
jgi:hypothetical protein